MIARILSAIGLLWFAFTIICQSFGWIAPFDWTVSALATLVGLALAGMVFVVAPLVFIITALRLIFGRDTERKEGK